MSCRRAWLWCALAGCATQMNYAIQDKLPASAFGPAETAEPAGREARLLLASARTVAFFPPDSCINVKDDDIARHRTLQANCGVALSSLERAAEKAGYEVVSWQNLRGNQMRPIDYARDAKVHVLFEINEFDFGPIDDRKLARQIDYTSYPAGGASSPYTPPPEVAGRCADYAGKRRKARIDQLKAEQRLGLTVAKVGVIDIKTVSVADGRNRWRYRKSLTRRRDVSFERVAFGSNPTTNSGAIVLSVFGGISLSVGGGLTLAQGLSSDDPMTDTDESIDLGSWPLLTLVSGAVLLAGGITLAVLTTKPGGPDLMCTDVGVTPLVTPASEPSEIDEEQENAEIRNEMISEFVAQIVDVRNSMPPPAPPAPAPPAPAPALDPAGPPAPPPAPAPAGAGAAPPAPAPPAPGAK